MVVKKTKLDVYNLPKNGMDLHGRRRRRRSRPIGIGRLKWIFGSRITNLGIVIF